MYKCVAGRKMARLYFPAAVLCVAVLTLTSASASCALRLRLHSDAGVGARQQRRPAIRVIAGGTATRSAGGDAPAFLTTESQAQRWGGRDLLWVTRATLHDPRTSEAPMRRRPTITQRAGYASETGDQGAGRKLGGERRDILRRRTTVSGHRGYKRSGRGHKTDSANDISPWAEAVSPHSGSRSRSEGGSRPPAGAWTFTPLPGLEGETCDSQKLRQKTSSACRNGSGLLVPRSRPPRSFGSRRQRHTIATAGEDRRHKRRNDVLDSRSAAATHVSRANTTDGDVEDPVSGKVLGEIESNAPATGDSQGVAGADHETIEMLPTSEAWLEYEVMGGAADAESVTDDQEELQVVAPAQGYRTGRRGAVVGGDVDFDRGPGLDVRLVLKECGVPPIPEPPVPQVDLLSATAPEPMQTQKAQPALQSSPQETGAQGPPLGTRRSTFSPVVVAERSSGEDDSSSREKPLSFRPVCKPTPVQSVDERKARDVPSVGRTAADVDVDTAEKQSAPDPVRVVPPRLDDLSGTAPASTAVPSPSTTPDSAEELKTEARSGSQALATRTVAAYATRPAPKRAHVTPRSPQRLASVRIRRAPEPTVCERLEESLTPDEEAVAEVPTQSETAPSGATQGDQQEPNLEDSRDIVQAAHVGPPAEASGASDAYTEDENEDDEARRQRFSLLPEQPRELLPQRSRRGLNIFRTLQPARSARTLEHNGVVLDESVRHFVLPVPAVEAATADIPGYPAQDKLHRAATALHSFLFSLHKTAVMRWKRESEQPAGLRSVAVRTRRDIVQLPLVGQRVVVFCETPEEVRFLHGFLAREGPFTAEGVVGRSAACEAAQTTGLIGILDSLEGLPEQSTKLGVRPYRSPTEDQLRESLANCREAILRNERIFQYSAIDAVGGRDTAATVETVDHKRRLRAELAKFLAPAASSSSASEADRGSHGESRAPHDAALYAEPNRVLITTDRLLVDERLFFAPPCTVGSHNCNTGIAADDVQYRRKHAEVLQKLRHSVPWVVNFSLPGARTRRASRCGSSDQTLPSSAARFGTDGPRISLIRKRRTLADSINASGATSFTATPRSKKKFHTATRRTTAITFKTPAPSPEQAHMDRYILRTAAQGVRSPHTGTASAFGADMAALGKSCGAAGGATAGTRFAALFTTGPVADTRLISRAVINLLDVSGPIAPLAPGEHLPHGKTAQFFPSRSPRWRSAASGSLALRAAGSRATGGDDTAADEACSGMADILTETRCLRERGLKVAVLPTRFGPMSKFLHELFKRIAGASCPVPRDSEQQQRRHATASGQRRGVAAAVTSSTARDRRQTPTPRILAASPITVVQEQDT